VNEDEHTVRLIDIFAKQIEMTTSLAVIGEQLKMIPDHENRIRALEKWRYGLPLTALVSVASLAVGAYGWLHH
jgi:hypothetical protein